MKKIYIDKLKKMIDFLNHGKLKRKKFNFGKFYKEVDTKKKNNK